MQSDNLLKIALDTEATHGIVPQKIDFGKPSYTAVETFVREQHKQWNSSVPDLEQYERELHGHVMAVECELLGEELARYDVSVEQVEVQGESYRLTLASTETYLSAAGCDTCSRSGVSSPSSNNNFYLTDLREPWWQTARCDAMN